MSIQTSFLNDKKFPLVVTSTSADFDIYEWASKSKSQIREWLDTYGCVLFRGFDIEGVDDFERMAEATTNNNWVEYLEATSPRDVVKSRTSTSTKYQNDKVIFWHNEKSYSSTWPYNLYFYCDVEPQDRGETPLADCRAIYKDLPWLLKRKFKSKKLMYVRKFSNNMGIPWKDAFGVNNQEEMEAYCKSNDIESLTWKDDGTPVLKYVRDTALEHPSTGEKCWFNHGTFFNYHSLEPDLKEFFTETVGRENLPYNTFFGDGSEISEKDINLLRKLYEKHSISFPWQKNDVLLIDNMLVAHGRNPFTGPRSILVTMTEPVTYAQTKTF